MKAIEMETVLPPDGKLPEVFREAFGHKARIIVLLSSGDRNNLSSTDPYSVPPMEYNEDDDPAIALISGPSDYSLRAEEILSAEIHEDSGWTHKEKSNGRGC